MSATEQLDIFASTHSRGTDPSTSRRAAESVNVKESCLVLLAAIWRNRWTLSSFTDGELASHVDGMERSVVARRRADLVAYGLVEPCWLDGEQEERRGPKGRAELVWVLSAAGCEAAAKAAA